MPSSANGWQVLDGDTSGSQPRLRKWVIPDVRREIPLRDGSAGFLLIHFATWFNHNIELIDMGYDDWGWSPRHISGSDDWSNHASGTAMDLNASRHPQGVPSRETFSATEVAMIQRRLTLYHDCIRWGGDYRSRPDAMHYELDQYPPAVEKRARELCVRGAIGKAVLRANPGVKAIIYT